MSDRLTAMDIQKADFKRKMRGFDPEEVQLFLRSVADEIERLQLDNTQLREALCRLDGELKEHKHREKTLQETLVSAQRMTAEMKERVRAEADLTLRDARMKAERTLQDGQDQLARLESEISRSRVERDQFEKRLRALVLEHLDLLDRRVSERARSIAESEVRAEDATAVEHNVHPIRRLGTDAG